MGRKKRAYCLLALFLRMYVGGTEEQVLCGYIIEIKFIKLGVLRLALHYYASSLRGARSSVDIFMKQ